MQSFLKVMKFNAYKEPDFKEKKAGGALKYIQFGENNDYPEYLIRLFQRSAKHSAIITGKVDYIKGNGWETEEGNTAAQSFIDAPNSTETLSELTDKAAMDLEIHNGFAFEVIPTYGGGKKLSHIAWQNLRTNADKSEFYYTKDWTKNDPSKNEDWQVFKPFNPKEQTTDKTLFYYCGYSPKVSKHPVYPLPDYIACIPYIEVDSEIANFHLNNIKSGIWGNFIFNFYNGIPNEEAQAEIEKRIGRNFSGTSGKRFMLNFADGKDRGMEAEPLASNDTDKLFDQLNQTVQQEIFSGHKVTSPMLFGIKTEGQLGGRTEMLTAYELFKNAYIRGRQDIIEDAVNYIYSGNRHQRILKLLEKEPIQETLDMQYVVPKMSDNEVRAMAGLPPIEAAAVDPSKDVLNKLNTMSPLVATKVLDSLTEDEVRGLAGLPPINKPLNAPVPAVSSATTTSYHRHGFANEEQEARVIQRFEQAGRPASDFEVLKTRRMWFRSMDEVEQRENRLMYQCFATPVSGEAASLPLSILKILDKTPDASPKEIAKQLKIAVDEVEKIINDLLEANYIETVGKKLTVTDSGTELLPPVEKKTVISIKYRYDKDPSVPGPVLLPTSRDFCRKLIQMDKLYDRKEIEAISSEEDYNVFLFRGGWYHNPRTNETTPYCRHEWVQVVVTEKS